MLPFCAVVVVFPTTHRLKIICYVLLRHFGSTFFPLGPMEALRCTRSRPQQPLRRRRRFLQECSAGQPANREERMCLRAVQSPSFLSLTSRHDFLERLRFYSAALDAEANTAQSDAAEPAAMPDGGFHSQRWSRFLGRGLLVALVKSRPMFQHSRTGKAAVFSTGNG